MTDIIETEPANYDEFVYQLDTEDELLGGEGGELNKATKNLANRTKWLKKQIENLESSSGLGVVPIGGIIMWHGNSASAASSLPKNWKFCNGENGTPDLRDKFVIGASKYEADVLVTSVTGSSTREGGSADAVVVSHTHTVYAAQSVFTQNEGGDNAGWYPPSNDDLTTSDARDASGTIIGESGAGKNLPPYYALAYIMRVS